MTHDESKWGNAYDPNCMCVVCHSIWESLIKAGDSVTINGWVDSVNKANK